MVKSFGIRNNKKNRNLNLNKKININKEISEGNNITQENNVCTKNNDKKINFAENFNLFDENIKIKGKDNFTHFGGNIEISSGIGGYKDGEIKFKIGNKEVMKINNEMDVIINSNLYVSKYKKTNKLLRFLL